MDVVKSITTLFSDVFDTFKQRVSSPVVGTFFFSWLLFNWELVYYFIGGNEEARRKINHIQLEYIDFTQNFCYPVTLTIAYLIIYPLILNISNTVWVVVDSKSKSFFSKYTETNVPISEEAQAKLFTHLREREEEYQSVLRDKQNEINALNEALNNQTGELKKLRKTKGEDSAPIDVPHLNKKQQAGLRVMAVRPLATGVKPSSDKELRQDVSSIIKSVDGSFLFDDLIADKMELEKDDKIHKRELCTSREILLKLIGSYPEPWPIKEITGVAPDGRSNMNYSKELVESQGKKLIKKGWLSVSEYGGVHSYSMTVQLIADLNELAGLVE